MFVASPLHADVQIKLSDYGIVPGKGKNLSPKMQKALKEVAAKHKGEKIVLTFSEGRYDFYPEGAAVKNYFISNHDQTATKSVGICIDGIDNVTIEGNGADLMFHGRMLPLAIVNSTGSAVKNLSIDFAEPHITQVTIKENGPDGMVFETAPWVNAEIAKNGRLMASGYKWSNYPVFGMAFEPDTRHIVYNTSDLWVPLDSMARIDKRTFRAYKWKNPKLVPGTVITLRTGARPAPGIFLSQDKDTYLENVAVHYAEGMGLLAQLCENITMTGFKVSLRGDSDPRYFTTQADATHFSGCKGLISSCGGLYENMMDDAINVHGTYLKVVEKIDDHTLVGRYMHNQSYGFDWGYPGDSVSFVKSVSMEIVGDGSTVKGIEPVTYSQETGGVLEFRITFANAIPAEVNPDEGFGVENLTWTPSVVFARNTIRNNRARGCLFSTPRPTLVEDNLFDHTSGTAVLLCGDCNGWYETGACRDVLVRNNRFVNSLTSLFQFTEAVISIYPEIPNLKAQTKYFHGGKNVPGIRIENNEFVTFDLPILYAKSTDGLKFTGNRIVRNHDYPAFHKNIFNLRFDRCVNVEIEENDFGEQSPSILFK